jgi:hypothetical protein
MASNKHNARKVHADGYVFDSGAEYYRYRQLLILQAAGEISGLIVHPRYVLVEPFTYNGKRQKAETYEPDFVYMEDGHMVAEDVKGQRLPLYRIKSKLFMLKFPHIEFREIPAKDVA